jgi:hypothetical protein
VLRLDGKVISRTINNEPISLGALDPKTPHVVGIEVQFGDGAVTRKQVVFGDSYSEKAPVELTAIAVRQRGASEPPAGGCLTVNGKKVEARGGDRGPANVTFVINSGADMTRRESLSSKGSDDRFALPETEVRVVSPALRPGRQGTAQFPAMTIAGAKGTKQVLLSHRPALGQERFADAIAAAGVRALRSEQRRAVVFVIGPQWTRDFSAYPPALVRSYLERIGVPFRVWSFIGTPPELEAWGPVQEVSTSAGLQQATEELRRELDSQRVALVPAAPLDALRTGAGADCAYEPLARLAQ